MEDLTRFLAFAAAALAALGGGGAIVLGLSNYLGKIWARRLMERERREHEQALDAFRDDLRRKTEKDIADFRAQIEMQHRYQFTEYAEKVALYRGVTDIVADIIVDVTNMIRTGLPNPTALENFERRRLRLYGYLGMMAPQVVMTSMDRVMDEILDMVDGRTPYNFGRIRDLSYDLLNEIRKDIALDKSPVTYTGRR